MIRRNMMPDERVTTTPEECDHLEDSRDYYHGNYIAPYGWEQFPGWYCIDCGEMVGEPGPDFQDDRVEVDL